jgi:hypothetical protein
LSAANVTATEQNIPIRQIADRIRCAFTVSIAQGVDAASARKEIPVGNKKRHSEGPLARSGKCFAPESLPNGV